MTALNWISIYFAIGALHALVTYFFIGRLVDGKLKDPQHLAPKIENEVSRTPGGMFGILITFILFWLPIDIVVLVRRISMFFDPEAKHRV